MTRETSVFEGSLMAHFGFHLWMLLSHVGLVLVCRTTGHL